MNFEDNRIDGNEVYNCVFLAAILEETLEESTIDKSLA